MSVKIESQKERKILRWSLILMIPVTIGVFGFQEFFTLPQGDDNLSVKSGFGQITMQYPQEFSESDGSLFSNVDLGFQVLAPNRNWDAHSVEEVFSTQKLESLKSKGLIHGFYLEEDHQRQFMITVFDVSSQDFALEPYIDSQINQMQSQIDVNVPIKQISDSKDWAIFAMEIPTENWNYGEQVLFLKDNRLFMLQYSGQNPNNLTLEKKSEYLSIIDSFEMI
ncbi:MAG: hypothetical protein PVI88_06520 [Nitrosopumilaceae archaeon]|jgi:hypothetical protein